MRLSNKICIVTGGASGIGRAASLIFAREGATVAIADKSGAAAGRVAEEAGNGAFAIEVDVSKSFDVERMIKQVVERCGRLDVLVNNAGYGIPGDVTQTDEDDWNRLMAVNINGVFFGCKYAIPEMRAIGGGSIINTASIVATVGIRDRAAYCASKGAVAALTRAMALDHVADKIRVNAIAPGTIDSPYFQEMFAKSPRAAEMRRELEARQAMNRLGQPEEIANGMLFLASDEASFMTGAILTIDGGMTAQ
ncbi:SDR family oxidoreductase [Xanthobacter wiegelii]|uniref:SDR family oxidoreductase n=1 Tax=Xanthobacter wiegelii TaxID=3119913 RepID=UPI00372BE428